MDGAALTALRTAAVSGLATRYLARAGARRLVIFGAGVQARSHLEAMRAVRPIEHVTVVSRTPGRAEALVEVARGLGVDAAVGGANDVAGADIVCTCTTSDVPVFDGGLLAPGVHVNAVGALQPDGARARHRRRWPGLGSSSRRAMPRSPRRATCASRSAKGRSAATTWSPTSRSWCAGPRSGRPPDDITLFKSVGVAFEDLIVARAAVDAVRGRAMTATADVVVVGGGVVGASAAYHLAAAGVEHVVLLERADSVATGSTGACAGGFRHQFSSRINIELSLASVPMITRVHARSTGCRSTSCRTATCSSFATSATGRDFRAGAELQRSLGVDTQLLTPDEAAAIMPGIAIDDIVGASFCADDGIADPAGLTQGYATLARRAGADVRLGVEVVEIETDDAVVTGVRTGDGVISAPVVVNAAGPWAGTLAATAGIHLPLEPIPRMVVTTGAFPGAPARRTLVIDAVTTFYFHQEGDGVLMGMGGRDERASFSTEVDDRFVDEELLPTAVRVFPPIEQAGLASMWVGLYEMTPDRHPIIGRSPVDGLLLANGFSGHGFQHAPVVGKLIAELIVDGRAHTVDISSLTLDRFDRGRPRRRGSRRLRCRERESNPHGPKPTGF